MKYEVKTLMAGFMALMSVLCHAQKSDPSGTLSYCLPSTVVSLEVEALQEKFYAGPYAKYAEKYLGVKAGQKDETAFHLTRIRMTPSVEADQSKRYSLFVEKGKIDGSFLKLSAEGLVSFGDAAMGGSTEWRFPTETSGDFSDKGVSSNLTSEATVLYKNDKKQSASKVSVQQNVIVTKSTEKKAAETAQMILDLRRQRLQIVTGDTDATYSGEAMKAAIDELTRLEDEYMTLFLGYSECQTQTMHFDVIPDPSREVQRYIAFRLSDATGLVPADNLSGKPIVMEFDAEKFQQFPELSEKEAKKAPAVLAYYRIPAICSVKLMEGTDILLQSRIPVYQLGQESSLPVNVILK